jgi:Kef-type K+ transport system membrane component KefB
VVTGFTLLGKSDLNKWAIGVGMIPRGEVGLVFAGVGAASGALDPATDAAIIVMVIVTTFVAPPWLRLVFQQKDQKLTPVITKEEPEILK